MKFRQLSVHLRELVSTTVNFQCSVTLPKTFHVAAGPSIKIPSTFHVSAGPCVSFHELSVHLWDLPSIFDNFMCVRRIFLQLSVWLRDFPSIFHVTAGPSVNFRQHCVRLRELSSTFGASKGPSATFPCVRRTIHRKIDGCSLGRTES